MGHLRRTRQMRRDFSPQDLPGMILWLRPERLASYTGQAPISLWFDDSGLGNHATASANHPLAERHPWWRAGGAAGGANGTQGMTLPTILNLAPVSCFIVAQRRGAEVSYTAMLVMDELGWYARLGSGGGNNWGMYVNGDIAGPGVLTGSAPPWVLSTVARAANDIDLVHNGSSIVNRTSGTATPINRGSTRLFDSGGIQAFAGMIAEVIVYDRAVTVGQRKAVEEYLYRRFAEPPAYALGAA